nr:hypothetical protein [uncultured Roseateles sp.]
MADLQRQLGMEGTAHDVPGESEAATSVRVRLEASQKGMRLWRNNVGVLQDETGRPVRYGLANDSPAVNKHIKSADLIGIRPVLIQPQHVGLVLGQFVSREMKEGGWQYKGTEREEAQLRWAQLVASLGGDAAFATGVGTL